MGKREINIDGGMDKEKGERFNLICEIPLSKSDVRNENDMFEKL